VGGEEYGASLLAELAHDLLEHEGGPGIETHHRFIEDQEAWFMDQCTDDSQFLLHATGERVDPVIECLMKTELPYPPGNPFFAFFGALKTSRT
jgi:hypothetical protein